MNCKGRGCSPIGTPTEISLTQDLVWWRLLDKSINLSFDRKTSLSFEFAWRDEKRGKIKEQSEDNRREDIRPLSLLLTRSRTWRAFAFISSPSDAVWCSENKQIKIKVKGVIIYLWIGLKSWRKRREKIYRLYQRYPLRIRKRERNVKRESKVQTRPSKFPGEGEGDVLDWLMRRQLMRGSCTKASRTAIILRKVRTDLIWMEKGRPFSIIAKNSHYALTGRSEETVNSSDLHRLWQHSS